MTDDEKGVNPIDTPGDELAAVLTPAMLAHLKTKALRLVLADLDDDDTRRRAAVYAQLFALEQEHHVVAFGVLGYLASQIACTLRSRHGLTGAIDVITAELATTIIGAGES